MMGGRIQRRLSWRAVTGRPGMSLAIFASSLVLAMLVTILVGGSGAFRAAVEQGADASFGGYAYQVGGGGEQSQSVLRSMANEGRAVGVVTGRGSVTATDGGVAAGRMVELSGPSRYGRLREGSHPQRSGEMSISVAVAEQLGVGVGDRLTLASDDLDLGAEPYAVTGVTVNPADTGEVMISAVTRSSTVLDRAQTWLTDVDPASIRELQSDLNSGNARVGFMDVSRRLAGNEVGSRELAAIPYFTALVFAVGLVGLSGLQLSMRAACRSAAEALMASGLPRGRAWRVAQRGFHIIPPIAGIWGLIVGWAMLDGLKSVIASHLHQQWDGIPVAPLLVAVLLVTGYTLLALLAVVVVFRRRKSDGALGSPTRHVRLWMLSGGLGVAVSLGLVASYLLQQFRGGVILGIVIGSVAWPVFLWHMPWLKSAPAISHALRATGRFVVPVLDVVLLAVACSSFFSASLMMRIDNATMPSDSYIAVQSINANDVSVLASEYPAIMKDAVVLAYPDESKEQLHAVNSGAVNCLKGYVGSQVDFECAKTQSFQNTVMFAPHTGAGSNLAGKATPLIGRETSVGIMSIDPATGKLLRLDTVSPVESDPLLGVDVMPGLVLDPDSDTSRKLGSAPSDRRLVYVGGFASFPDKDKNAFRTDVLTRAGYAVVSESDNVDYRQMHAMAVTLPCFAGLIAIVALVALALGLRAQQRGLREAMVACGASRRQLGKLAMPLIATAVVSVMAMAFTGWWGAHADIHLWGSYFAEYYHQGWYWTIPIFMIACACIGIMAAGMRGRDPAGEMSARD